MTIEILLFKGIHILTNVAFNIIRLFYLLVFGIFISSYALATQSHAAVDKAFFVSY